MKEYIPSLIALAGLNLVALISPGPDFAVVVRNSLLYSRRTALLTALGIALGILVHLSYIAFGLGVIIEETDWLMTTFKWLGAGYLFFIGCKGLTAKKVSPDKSAHIRHSAHDISAVSAIRLGFLTNAFNPKCLLFFLSLFSVVIPPHMPLSLLLLAGVIVFIEALLWFSFVAFCLSGKKTREKFQAVGHWIERITGGLLVGLGIKILFGFLAISLLTPSLYAKQSKLMSQSNTLYTLLANKKIGVIFGSFDPLHKGHEKIVNLSLSSGKCDYVIIYPLGEEDKSKKRVNLKVRLKMLEVAFKDNPRVIVNDLSPKELQNVLTAPIKESDEVVSPKFPGTEFVGISGADAILAYRHYPSAQDIFFSGKVIPQKYEKHILGAMMALPAQTFIAFEREGSDISEINENAGRPIIAKIDPGKYRHVSSTSIRELIKNDQPIEEWVSAGVLKIIREEKLYLGN